MRDLWMDLRDGLRQMARARGVTVTIVLTLALGIGATSGIFTVVNAVVLRALPYEHPDQLVAVRLMRTANGRETSISADITRMLTGQTGPLQDFALAQEDLGHLTGGSEPERVLSAAVSGNFFSVLGARAELGRTFTANEGASAGVAILSHGLWASRFGADPSVIGRTIHLDDQSYEVVGVMPATVRYPEYTEIWTTGVQGADQHRIGSAPYDVIARLKPRVNLDAAQAAADVVTGRLTSGTDQPLAGYRIHLLSLKDTLIYFYDRLLLMLLGAVGFVLLIACGNVANLLLSRAAGRQREMAVRASLGASRARLLRQLLTEGVLLTAFAGALGLAVAQWTVDGFLALAPERLLTLWDIGIDSRVLAFTAGLAALTGIACSLSAAWHLSRPNLQHGLAQAAPAAAGSRGRWAAGRLLLAGEIALSAMLLVGTALAVRSLLRLSAVDPGFQTTQVLTAQLTPYKKYRGDDRLLRLYQQALAQVRRVPGVESAAATNAAPFATQVAFPIQIVAEAETGLHTSRGRFSIASRGYFRTLGIPIVAGRDFTATEDTSSIIVNETLARRFWPGGGAVGHRIGFTTKLLAPPPSSATSTIVGVVADNRDVLQRAPEPHVYEALSNFPSAAAYLVVRTRIDPTALIPQIKAAVWSIDPDQPLSEIHTMKELRADEMSLQELLTVLLSSFGIVAALLALVGYWVSQRTHEFGVRAALGASPVMLTGLGVRQILWPVLLGAALGLAGALGLSRLLAHYLFEAGTSHATMAVLVVTAETSTALLAAWWPARRAGRVDPAVALREE
jgi:predicted permease